MSRNYHPDDAAQWAHRPIRSTVGDEKLDRLLGERRFEDAPVRPCRGRVARPEPLVVPGAGSSLTGAGGGSMGVRQGSAWHSPLRGR